MYGLVNKGLQDFVTSKVGKEGWNKIREKAEVSEQTFVSMLPYPDEITYKLAIAAAETLGVSLEAALEGFGEYWILFTADEGYGDLVKMCGNNVGEFLSNMNNLHSRIRLTHPALIPPKIICTDQKEHSLILHYYSNRPGLTSMMIGLVKGLGKRFETPATIRSIKSKKDGHDHDEFEVTY